MKKLTKLLVISSLVFTSYAYAADITPVKILTKCTSDSGSTVLKAVPHQDVVISSPQLGSRLLFKSTDSNGFIYIDESYAGKLLQIDLAQGKTIIIDCRSRLTPTNSGAVILGERGSSCPSNLCNRD